MFRARTLIATALVAAAPVHAQITNGSFETPAVPLNNFTSYLVGSSFDGWNVVGPPGGNVAVVNTAFQANGFLFQAHSGAQWLDLTGFSNNASGVEQTVTTIVGTTYNLSFWVGSVFDPNQVFGTSSTVNPFVNGVALAAATATGTVGTNNHTWTQFTRSFTATSTSTTIRFLNGDAINDSDNGLDDVTLAVVPQNTVPEPATVALVATGLAGLVTIARRRRSA